MALHIHTFEFNPFQENTYLIYTDTKQGVIVDPGNSTPEEDSELDTFIEKNAINIQDVWLTHAHIDHVLGIQHVVKTYGKNARLHSGELPLYERAEAIGQQYGVQCKPLPVPIADLEPGMQLQLGNYTFDIVFTPGHSPASVCFIEKTENKAIVGDVLFKKSIGRTDLPGGDYDTLIASIQNQLFVLDSRMEIYPGHGPKSTIGYEKVNNPFFN